MVQFANWCTFADTQVGNHHLCVLTGSTAHIDVGIDATAALVPGHYASEEHIARVLRLLGKPAAAAMIEQKLPTTKAIRSGDLGEILATEWIAANGTYQVPVKRLRWKDHRNMAMRGEDVIGIALDPATLQLSFLKTEAKSRGALTGQVVLQAREGLDKDSGLPPGHAPSFISARAAITRSPMRSTMRPSNSASSRIQFGICSSPSRATRPRRCSPTRCRIMPAAFRSGALGCGSTAIPPLSARSTIA